jgi:hypothetical protein
MTTIYKILNPLNGEYTTANSFEECSEFVADLAVNILNNFTQNAPYSVVDINEDGSQTWRTPQGVEIVNLEELTVKIKTRVGMPLTSIPVTPVETMP